MLAAEPRQTTELDAHIGANIRARREAVNLRQTDVAEQIGISYQQYQRYEQGRSRIAAALLLRVAAVLDCDAQDLFGDKPKTGGPKAGDDYMSVQLLHAFEQIRFKRERTMVLALARRLAQASRISRQKR